MIFTVYAEAKMSQAEELAREYEQGKGDDINPGTGGKVAQHVFTIWGSYVDLVCRCASASHQVTHTDTDSGKDRIRSRPDTCTVCQNLIQATSLSYSAILTQLF